MSIALSGCGSTAASRGDAGVDAGRDAPSMDASIDVRHDAPTLDVRAERTPTSCTTAGDCKPTEGCVAGVCAPCVHDHDCGADETCATGICSSKCDVTLASIIAGTAEGGTVTVPACVYRELVTLAQAITLVARPGAEIRGSDVWTSWTAGASGTWTSADALASPVTNDACVCSECVGDPVCATGSCSSPADCACAAKANCYLPQQVFVDGAPLQQIAAGTPAKDQFVLDLTSGAITLGLADDPSKHVIEVTTRDHWLVASQPLTGVTLRGFTMRHAASPPQHGALDTTGGACGTTTGWTVADNHLLYAAGGCLTPNAGDQILDNEIAFGGQEGANTTCLDKGLMRGNKIHDNNTENFDPGWEAAGVKGALTFGAVFDHNEVYDNRNGAAGLWCDINCYDIRYSNNTITHNSGSGILFEISDKATITGNTVKDNGPTLSCCGGSCPAGSGCSFYSGGQIVVSASPNVTVSNNTVSGVMGIGVLQQYRADACTCPTGSPNTTCCSPGLCSGSVPYHHVENVSVHDNEVTESLSAAGAGNPAGLVTDFCNGTCGGNTAMAGAACDPTFYFTSGVVKYANNTYHSKACDEADWSWDDKGIPFASWQSGGEDVAGHCGP